MINGNALINGNDVGRPNDFLRLILLLLHSYITCITYMLLSL